MNYISYLGLRDNQVVYLFETDNESIKILQPYSLNSPHYDGNNEPVWQFDGNDHYPTLIPSFDHDRPRDNVRIHLFLKKGKIILLPDSKNVSLKY